MKIITINLSPRQVKALAVLEELGVYPSRSEAIRVAIRDFLFEKYLGFFKSNASNGEIEELKQKKAELERLANQIKTDSELP